MKPERIAALESVGFVWDPYTAQWNERYECAKKYYDAHDNISITKDYNEQYGTSLKYWISSQRKACKDNRLDNRQVELLRQIGVVN